MTKKIIVFLLIMLMVGIISNEILKEYDTNISNVFSSIFHKIEDIPLFDKSLNSYDKVRPFGDTTFKIVYYENKVGIVKDNGKVVIPIVYDSIKKVGNYYCLANTDKDGDRQSALIDSNLKIVLPASKGNISYSDKMYIYDYEDKYKFYSDSLEFLFEVQSEIRPILGGQYIHVKQQGKDVFVDYHGNRVIKDDYERIIVSNPPLSFSKGLGFPILKNSKWGIISLKNEYFIPCEYDDIKFDDFQKTQQIWFKKGSKWGSFDANNNIVIPFVYPAVPQIVGKNFIVIQYSGEQLNRKNVYLNNKLVLQRKIDEFIKKEKDMVIDKKNKEYLKKINDNKDKPVKFVCGDRYECKLKDAGLTLSMGIAGAFSVAEANRYYTKGKYYFETEILFVKPKENRFLMFEDVGIMYKSPDARHCSSKSNSRNCKAYGWNFSRDILKTIKSGDIIGVAVDFDNSKIYNSLNGEWVVGNPQTGTSPYTFDTTGNKAYTVFAQATRYSDMKLNFGAKPFKYIIPKGFRPYDTN